MTISRSLTPDRSPAGATGGGAALGAAASAGVAPAPPVAGARCDPPLAGSSGAERTGAVAGPDAGADELPLVPARSGGRVEEEVPAASVLEAGVLESSCSGAVRIAGAMKALPAAPSWSPTPGFCPQPAATRTA